MKKPHGADAFGLSELKGKKKVNVYLKKAASVCLSTRQCQADGQGWERLCSQAEQLSCIFFYFSACTIATTSTQKLLVQFLYREGTVAFPAQGRFWQCCFPKTPGPWFHIPPTRLISSNTATLNSAVSQQLQSTKGPFLLALRPSPVLVY